MSYLKKKSCPTIPHKDIGLGLDADLCIQPSVNRFIKHELLHKTETENNERVQDYLLVRTAHVF